MEISNQSQREKIAEIQQKLTNDSQNFIRDIPRIDQSKNNQTIFKKLAKMPDGSIMLLPNKTDPENNIKATIFDSELKNTKTIYIKNKLNTRIYFNECHSSQSVTFLVSRDDYFNCWKIDYKNFELELIQKVGKELSPKFLLAAEDHLFYSFSYQSNKSTYSITKSKQNKYFHSSRIISLKRVSKMLLYAQTNNFNCFLIDRRNRKIVYRLNKKDLSDTIKPGLIKFTKMKNDKETVYRFQKLSGKGENQFSSELENYEIDQFNSADNFSEQNNKFFFRLTNRETKNTCLRIYRFKDLSLEKSITYSFEKICNRLNISSFNNYLYIGASKESDPDIFLIGINFLIKYDYTKEYFKVARNFMREKNYNLILDFLQGENLIIRMIKPNNLLVFRLDSGNLKTICIQKIKEFQNVFSYSLYVSDRLVENVLLALKVKFLVAINIKTNEIVFRMELKEHFHKIYYFSKKEKYLLIDNNYGKTLVLKKNLERAAQFGFINHPLLKNRHQNFKPNYTYIEKMDYLVLGSTERPKIKKPNLLIFGGSNLEELLFSFNILGSELSIRYSPTNNIALIEGIMHSCVLNFLDLKKMEIESINYKDPLGNFKRKIQLFREEEKIIFLHKGDAKQIIEIDLDKKEGKLYDQTYEWNVKKPFVNLINKGIVVQNMPGEETINLYEVKNGKKISELRFDSFRPYSGERGEQLNNWVLQLCGFMDVNCEIQFHFDLAKDLALLEEALGLKTFLKIIGYPIVRAKCVENEDLCYLAFTKWESGEDIKEVLRNAAINSEMMEIYTTEQRKVMELIK